MVDDCFVCGSFLRSCDFVNSGGGVGDRVRYGARVRGGVEVETAHVALG